jgi:hypothetical protein
LDLTIPVGPEIPSQLKTQNVEGTCSRRAPLSVVVQATHLWDLSHAAEFGRLLAASDRWVHVKRSMSAIAMTVAQIELQGTREMPVVQYDDMIEELSADTGDDSPDRGVLPRTPSISAASMPMLGFW